MDAIERARLSGWRFVLKLGSEISLEITVSRGGKPFVQTEPFLRDCDLDYSFSSLEQALAFARIVAQQGEKRILAFLKERPVNPVSADDFLRELFQTFPKKSKH